VQVSACPARYQPAAADAQRIVNALWAGQNPAPSAPALPSQPVVHNVVHNPASGTLEVYRVGTDGHVYEKWWRSAGSWSSWHDLG
jgi:hypothetical protein